MKKLIVSIWPIFLIVIVWFIFSYPYFLQHKVPFSSLYSVNSFAPWSAYHLYDGPIKNGAMPDVITQIIPWRHFTIESWKSGQIPLWNPYSFSGTPHLANYQSAVLSPFNILFFIFSFVDAWSLLVLLQPLLAGLFMYIYGRSLKISKTGSIISSIAFMFCGFITTWMDYATLGYAILFLPLALFSIEKFIDTNKTRYMVLLSLTVPLSFFSGHFQISLYFLIFVIIYIFYKWFITKNLHTTCYMLLATFIGLLLSMPQILPSLEFYNQSLRSNLFQQIEAIPLGYLPTFLSPDFFGNPVTRNDWFGHYAEWNGYIGLLPFMLGIYSIISAGANLRHHKVASLRQFASKRFVKAQTIDIAKSRFIIFLSLLSIIVLLLAFSTPVLNILIALHIPVLSTSAASRIIVLFSFIFAILAGFGFDALSEDVIDKKLKQIFIWLISFTIIFLLLWIVIVLKLFIPIEKIAIAKQNLKLPTIILGIIVIVVCCSTFNVVMKSFGKGGKPFPANGTLLLTSCFLILTSFDLLRFATKWQPFDPRQFLFPAVAVTQNLPKKEQYERMYGNYGAEMAVYNNVPAVDGYDPLYIQRYGEFIGSLDGQVTESARSVVTFPQGAKYTPQALKLLNITYIAQKNSDNGKPWGFPFPTYPLSQFTPIYNDGSYTIYKNNIPSSHVFLAQNYLVKTNAQDSINTLFAKQTNLRNTLVLEKDPLIPQGGVMGSAHITNYSAANTITVDAQTNHPSLLFLSEVFYPGWNAYVDGKSTEIYRTDYTFRSIVVPSGKHIIVFRYQPMSFTLGVWLCFLGILGIVSFPFINRRKLLQ